MSVKKDIWTVMKSKLLELKNSGTIQHYARWNNQIVKEGQEISFARPAVFVQMAINWNTTGIKPDNANQYNKQIGICTMTLHCVFEKYTDESTAYDELDESLDVIIEKFHLLDISAFVTPLVRSNERLDEDHNNIIIHEVDYTCQVQETFENKNVVDATGGDDNKIQLTLNMTVDA